MTDSPLPTLVTVSNAFNQRLPSQRVLDLIRKLEPEADHDFGEFIKNQPFRVIAFRALLRDFPDRDPTSMWLHSYDVEVDVTEDDPFSPNGPTPTPPSLDTGVSGQTR
jgi:hypothetical protein